MPAFFVVLNCVGSPTMKEGNRTKRALAYARAPDTYDHSEYEKPYMLIYNQLR